ncbi:MAG: Hpt domain-containing protein [Thalassobaculum sp.]|uniref:chemotaxis protein CheA n=1 Tax=Thalassobaculum sp. TaxID=2022740 RepID=UPI0032ECBA2C
MDDFETGASGEMWELFEQESESYLAQVEQSLSGTAADLQDPARMSALFRAMHSFKGVAASLGLTGLEAIAHRAEDLLDMFRNGEAVPDEATRDLLLFAADSLSSLREDCLAQRADLAGDSGLLTQLAETKARLKSGRPAPAARRPAVPAGGYHDEPAEAADDALPEGDDEPEEVDEPMSLDTEAPGAGPGAMTLQVSREAADPSETEFQDDVVGAFDEVVSGELGNLAEALENPSLDAQEIEGSILPIREAANEAGYFGIAAVLNDIQTVLRESEELDRTALTRGLCIFVHRLRILSELADSGLSMENVEDSLSPHIATEAREVIDRLWVEHGQTRDWELVGILSRALGVPRLSALARLTSELTAMDGWRDRPGALAVVEEIRRETPVIGIAGLDVSSLDVRHAVYDRLRDEMAMLLTNAEASVAELRDKLGDDIFNSLSPAARNEIAEFLKTPGSALLEVRALMADDDPGAQELMGRLSGERVISNRILIDIDPNLYQFLIGIEGTPDDLVADMQSIDRDRTVLQSWTVLIESTAEGAPPPARPKPTPKAAPKPVPRPGPAAAARPAARPARPAAVPPPEPAPMPMAVASPTGSSTAAELVPSPPEAPARSLEDAKEPVAAKAAGGSSLRVSSDLVDSYLDSVAELRLCLSRLEQGVAEAGFPSTTAELRSAATQTSPRTAERLRTAARQIDNASKVIASQIARAETTLRMLHGVTLDLRVVPISMVLGRMPRLVRDLARSLGKQVTLEIDDGDIQIDKSMVDALTEPLVHMIRNAMDHGIEAPDDRERLGKPGKATITLKATQNGNVARIMIADDGRGLNTAVIRAKAIERGLISDQDAARMSDREIQRQIFAPGFSTASAITETSGRGVGMDVVLVTIRRLGGSIDIDSVEGEGTTFYLNFPVSAALQRIVVVSDGERDLGLPERAVIEVIEVERSAIQTVGELAGIHHRDGFLPVRSIESMLGWDTPDAAANRSAFPVVILGTAERRVGVAVARIKRRQEVFMKELHPALSSVDVLAGATVMGEGQPLLVLDPDTLIAIAGA